jgi:iron transport multicopper oxidase
MRVGLSGTAGTGGRLAIAPDALDLGGVALGQSAVASLTVANAGDTPLAIMKSKPPAGAPFEALDALDEGTTLAAGASRTLRVRFTPAQEGPAAATWTITAADGAGAHAVALTGTGTVAGGSPPAADAVTAVPGAPASGPLSPGLGAKATGPPFKLRPDLVLLRPRFAQGNASLRIAGRATGAAEGAVGVRIAVRVRGRLFVVVARGRMHRGRFVLTLPLARQLRSWSRLRVTVRYGGSDRVSPGSAAVVLDRRRIV